MDELRETVETLIELDEPEAMMATIRRAAERQKGERWRRVAEALARAEDTVMAQQAPPQAAAVDADAEAKSA